MIKKIIKITVNIVFMVMIAGLSASIYTMVDMYLESVGGVI